MHDIPFLEFQDILGLPKRDVTGGNSGVDYMAFLMRFRPVSTVMTEIDSKTGKGPDGKPLPSADARAQEMLEQMVEMLSKNRYELESLFRHFDVNGDGEISVTEFKDGLASLCTLLKRPYSDQVVDALVSRIDLNKDGVLSYEEFFSGFEVVDPKLAASQRDQRLKLQQKRAFKKHPSDLGSSKINTSNDKSAAAGAASSSSASSASSSSSSSSSSTATGAKASTAAAAPQAKVPAPAAAAKAQAKK